MDEDLELEDDELSAEETVLEDVGPIDDPEEVEIVDSETEHDEDEAEVEEPIDFEHDLFDETEIEEAERDAEAEEDDEPQLDDVGELAKIDSDEFTCTRCFLIRDEGYLSSKSTKKAPYCIYCE